MTPTILEAVFENCADVGTDEQLHDLKQEILVYANSTTATDFTNPNCWRGNYKLFKFDYVIDRIKDLAYKTIKYYSEKDHILNEAKDKELVINYWANVNRPGSRNVLHAHKPGIVSGVYYIQGTGTGDLRIVNPANVLGDCNPEAPFCRDFMFSPKDKDLIMWPSWLPHEVETNLSNKDRINVAFDVSFKNEN